MKVWWPQDWCPEQFWGLRTGVLGGPQDWCPEGVWGLRTGVLSRFGASGLVF